MNISKKIISVCVVLCILVGFASCSTSNNTQVAFASAQKTYNILVEAYEKIDVIGVDIYEAWRIGIYETPSLAKLESELSLSSEELNVAADSLAGYSDIGNSVFYWFDNVNKFSICVSLVNEAYVLNGTYEEIESLLNSAKVEMKTMSEQYSDYEHYENLKKMYSIVDSYLQYCKEPTGSFEQVKTTLNDYRNDIRDLESDLGYIFE